VYVSCTGGESLICTLPGLAHSVSEPMLVQFSPVEAAAAVGAAMNAMTTPRGEQIAEFKAHDDHFLFANLQRCGAIGLSR
jgi:hypothetical protein